MGVLSYSRRSSLGFRIGLLLCHLHQDRGRIFRLAAGVVVLCIGFCQEGQDGFVFWYRDLSFRISRKNNLRGSPNVRRRNDLKLDVVQICGSHQRDVIAPPVAVGHGLAVFTQVLVDEVDVHVLVLLDVVHHRLPHLQVLLVVVHHHVRNRAELAVPVVPHRHLGQPGLLQLLPQHPLLRLGLRLVAGHPVRHALRQRLLQLLLEGRLRGLLGRLLPAVALRLRVVPVDQPPPRRRVPLPRLDRPRQLRPQVVRHARRLEEDAHERVDGVLRRRHHDLELLVGPLRRQQHVRPALLRHHLLRLREDREGRVVAGPVRRHDDPPSLGPALQLDPVLLARLAQHQQPVRLVPHDVGHRHGRAGASLPYSVDVHHRPHTRRAVVHLCLVGAVAVLSQDGDLPPVPVLVHPLVHA
eukprot:Rhum_TRINITY_DN20658_c0_g1::Rhum_TRINITY_DN20658_c0_g1_i1::g.171715::m.171715